MAATVSLIGCDSPLSYIFNRKIVRFTQAPSCFAKWTCRTPRVTAEVGYVTCLVPVCQSRPVYPRPADCWTGQPLSVWRPAPPPTDRPETRHRDLPGGLDSLPWTLNSPRMDRPAPPPPRELPDNCAVQCRSPPDSAPSPVIGSSTAISGHLNIHLLHQISSPLHCHITPCLYMTSMVARVHHSACASVRLRHRTPSAVACCRGVSLPTPGAVLTSGVARRAGTGDCGRDDGARTDD